MQLPLLLWLCTSKICWDMQTMGEAFKAAKKPTVIWPSIF